MLKGGAPHIQRQIEALCRIFDKGENLGSERLEGLVSADEPGPWEHDLQLLLQAFRLVAKQNGTDPFLARGNKHRAKRARTDGVAYRLPRAA